VGRLPKLDILIKWLIKRQAADWVHLVYPAADDIRSMNREMTPKVQSRLDTLFQVVTPTGPAIVHIEVQGYREVAFPARMLRYRADIWEHSLANGQGTPPIHQAAVFFLSEHDQQLQRMEDDEIHYQYRVVRLWEISREAILSQGLTGLYPLLPLMRDMAGDTPDAVMKQALDGIGAAAMLTDAALTQDLIAILGIIGGEKYGPAVVRRYIGREMLMQSEVYKEWIADDIREAEARGAAQAMRENILDILTDRFTVVRQPLRDKINTVADVGVLKALLKQSARVTSLEEFDHQLEKLISA